MMINTEYQQQQQKPCKDQHIRVTFKMQEELNKYAGQKVMPVLALTVQADVTQQVF